MGPPAADRTERRAFRGAHPGYGALPDGPYGRLLLRGGLPGADTGAGGRGRESVQQDLLPFGGGHKLHGGIPHGPADGPGLPVGRERAFKEPLGKEG